MKHPTYTDEKGFEYTTTGGICFETRWYADEARAKEFAASVRASGRTANGGYYHGMPLGSVDYHVDRRLWMVTC